MSGPQEENDDKPFEATQKKLDDARRKGEIARSADLNTAVAYAGLLLAFLMTGPWAVERMGGSLRAMLDRPEELAPLILAEGGRAPATGLIADSGLVLAALTLLPGGLVLACVTAQRGWAASAEKIAPKLSRISPLSNMKNKYGRSGLFEFAKSFVKLLIYSLVLGLYLMAQAPDMLSSVHLEPGLATVLMGRLGLGFLAVVLAISLAIGVVDALFQRAEHLRKHRMSHKEMTDEQKHTEGDPHMKQERRQRGYDIATNRMLADVPKSDVVIVNPEHYAVALSWSRARGAAPRCVAKGVDEVAARIRAAAAEAGIPIHRDPPTARALHAGTEIGQEIDPGQYRAVAAAIRFADAMRKKRRGR
jgi:flagellar biosynthetic protein FlhB